MTRQIRGDIFVGLLKISVTSFAQSSIPANQRTMGNFTPLQEYFYYTRSERNACIVLSFLCLFFMILPEIMTFFPGAKEKVDFTEFQEEIAAFSSRIAAEASEDKPSFRVANAEGAVEIRYFPFDPNTASKEDFLLLGLSPKVAQTILNYRAKGGTFYRKEDLKKLYTLREEDYVRLEPWVQIAPISQMKQPEKATTVSSGEQNPAPFSSQFLPKEREPVIIDINQATAEDWQKLKGIGPGYSRRIVNYREKLGGFYSIRQVGETFGLPDSTFQQMLPFLKDSQVFRKIKVNSATEEELKNHPYLSNFQAKVLLNYRMQHGPFTDMASLKKIQAAFGEHDWERLEPYISFE